jgi:hypothetical protein
VLLVLKQWVPAVLAVRAEALGSVGVNSVGVGTVDVGANWFRRRRIELDH